MWICSVIHEILVNKDFTVTDDMISWLFVVTFVHPAYVQIALIWGFIVQLSLWNSIHWLWKYKLNKVCNTYFNVYICQDCWRWTSFIFIFSLLFDFSFSFILYFLSLEQLGLGVISHAVTSVTNWWHSHKTDHGTWENEVERTRIKWCHTAWTTHANLM